MVKIQFVEYFEETKMGKLITQPLLKPFGGGSVSVFQPSLASTSSSVAIWCVVGSCVWGSNPDTLTVRSCVMVFKGNSSEPGYFQCFY